MSDTPMTDKIMRLHREAMHKLATPANELGLQSAVESLERALNEAENALEDQVQWVAAFAMGEGKGAHELVITSERMGRARSALAAIAKLKEER